MSDQTSGVLALKNAWAGAVSAGEAVRALNATVQALPAETTVDKLDLERYHQLVLADANAAQALRGLVEQLRARLVPTA